MGGKQGAAMTFKTTQKEEWAKVMKLWNWPQN